MGNDLRRCWSEDVAGKAIAEMNSSKEIQKSWGRNAHFSLFPLLQLPRCTKCQPCHPMLPCRPRPKISFSLGFAYNVPHCSTEPGLFPLRHWAEHAQVVALRLWSGLRLNKVLLQPNRLCSNWFLHLRCLRTAKTGLMSGQLLGYSDRNTRMPRASWKEDTWVTGVGFLWWMEPIPWTEGSLPSPPDSWRHQLISPDELSKSGNIYHMINLFHVMSLFNKKPSVNWVWLHSWCFL